VVKVALGAGIRQTDRAIGLDTTHAVLSLAPMTHDNLSKSLADLEARVKNIRDSL
jgi:hypothetical protein